MFYYYLNENLISLETEIKSVKGSVLFEGKTLQLVPSLNQPANFLRFSLRHVASGMYLFADKKTLSLRSFSSIKGKESAAVFSFTDGKTISLNAIEPLAKGNGPRAGNIPIFSQTFSSQNSFSEIP
jgi:hypothetical protein